MRPLATAVMAVTIVGTNYGGGADQRGDQAGVGATKAGAKRSICTR